LALGPLRDRVTIKRDPGKSRRMEIRVTGEGREGIPSDPASNSAGRVIKRMAREFGIQDDLTVLIEKGVPTGSGLGSSGASAVAAAVALNALFDLRIKKTDLVEFAVEGELASAGTRHYDNVSPSLLGGFVIVRTSPQLEFIRIDPPKDLVLVVALPLIEVPMRKTEFARRLLPETVPLKSVVYNVSNASTLVAGFLLRDVEMIARGINDIIVEPSRRHLIPGYHAVRRRALEAGALAVAISGAGPSLMSFLKTARDGRGVAKAMAEGFQEANIRSRTFICKPSGGARVVR
jgi:homoserine kinase